MQIQEEIVKYLAEYFFEILPNEGWSTFYYNIGIDSPKPQIISFGKIIGQGLSSYYCEPKENFTSFSNELRDNFLNSDKDE